MNNNDADEQLESFLQQVRQKAERYSFSADQVIDLEKSRTILQVTQGDVATAVQLYWDDFLATHGAGAPQNDREEEEPMMEEPPPRPRVRRRLEREFNREAENDEEPDENDDDDDDDDDDDGVDAVPGAGVARILAQARETVRRLEGGRAARQQQREEEEDGENVAGLAAAARAAEAILAARREQEGNESVSVSDDESGGVWRMVAAGLQNEKRPRSRGEGIASPKRKRRKTDDHGSTKKKKNGENMETDGYLSDNDWVWESFVSRTSIPLCTPFDFLWGVPPPAAENSNRDAAPGDGGEVQPEGIEGNVIADDDGDDESTGDRSGIPRAWSSAGFTLSEDCTGLALESPGEDDISVFAWQQQASGENQNTPPPPFHCGSISAILSIVTGLLYTGAAFQTQSVSCSTPRKPFIELTKEEKKREFEPRLADALSALLFIAAKSSRDRKELALQKLKKSKRESDMRKWQTVRSKLRLCPTCTWDTDSNGDSRLPQGRDSDRDLQLATSYTNIQDLRAYVMSNMRSFTARGGCALFLETVLRIHGRGALVRMQKAACRKANLPPSDKCLISCTCEDRNKLLRIPPAQLKQRSKTKELMEVTPDGHECLSVELISLLLTGNVHCSWKGWSTGPLGLGFLSHEIGLIGKGLTRPQKPVWVLRGPKLYSVLWMNGGYESPESFARSDRPDSVVALTHSCCWPGQRHKTTLRLAPGRSEWQPPSTPSNRKEKTTQPHSSLEEFFKRSRQTAPVSSELLQLGESISPSLVVTEDELDHVVANEEDQKFYKDKYRMWRYLSGTGNWVPFHRLSDREKHAVECKLGPKISTILWTRWPRADIDGFEPEVPEPLV